MDPQKVNTPINTGQVGQTNDTGATQRKREPNSRRDFRSILTRDEAAEKEAAEQRVRAKVGGKQKKSIFDLQEGVTAQAPPTDAQTDLAGLAAASTGKEPKKPVGWSDYTQPQADLSYLNPPLGQRVASAQSFDIEANVAGGGTSKTLPVQQIVDQIVDKLYTLSQEGRTDTILTLRNPPELMGADVVLTSYDHARGEFNIAFHNLTQAAEKLLADNNFRLGLKQALEEKGYTIHIMVATTEPYTRVLTADEAQSNQQRQREQGEEGQRGQDEESQDQRG